MTMSWVRSRRTAAGTEEPIARRWRVLGVLTLLVLASVVVPASPASATTLPPGFTDTLVTTVDQPMALAWTPDNRMLIATKAGQVRVHRNGALPGHPRPGPGRSAVTNAERGCSGSRSTPSSPPPATSTCTTRSTSSAGARSRPHDTPVNRVSRFTMNRTTNVIALVERAHPDQQHPQLRRLPQRRRREDRQGRAPCTSAWGDGICDYSRRQRLLRRQRRRPRPPHPVGQGAAHHPHRWHPHQQPVPRHFSSRCNVTGRTAAGRGVPGDVRMGPPKPVPHGVRPERHRDPLLHQRRRPGRVRRGGPGAVGADYGWNTREGFCATGSTTDCGSTPFRGSTNPVFAYGQEAGCAAITGGAFLPPAGRPRTAGRTCSATGAARACS